MWRKVGAATCVPLTLAAIQSSAWAQPDEVLGSTFTFHHENVLGTSLELRMRAHDLASARRAETAALAEFDRQDRILSSWRQDSELSRWAATRFRAVPVSPELYRTLVQFDMWRKKTGGALDPSVEAAARLWRAASAKGRTPTNDEIAQTVEAMQQPHWSLDPTNRTATRLTDVPLTFATFVKSSISSAAADAALNTGATGVMLNVGGDVVVRGAMSQIVSIADPRASAANDPALEHVVVRDRAVATSGSYRRGVEAKTQLSLRAPKLSHILDPRTATPTGHVLSSTVIAGDAETAGALATAFSVLPVEESRELAARIPGVDYVIVTRDGESVRSAGLEKYGVPALRTAAYAPAADTKPAAGMWNTQFELAIGLEIARISDARAKRPYVAVWIEDADHFPVRTLALWTEKPRWIPELKQWYRDEQIRSMAEGNDLSRTVSSATRPAGQYTLTWDGKDNEGKLVKAGTYTVCVEASREHGSYQIERHALDFKGQPQEFAFPAGQELGAVNLEYRKR
jgi:thiamine biosynthesis lipoprotein ApbE